MDNNKTSSSSPIGFFDSGLGGLTILSEVYQMLPNEQLIYLADSKNAPYGKKSKEEIIALSIKNTEKLIDLGCKMIVVACNTATTNAIKYLRENYNIPFIGIEPAIKPAALNSKTDKVGVLATKGTLSSELFMLTSKKFENTQFIEVEGVGLVEIVESGELEKAMPLLEQYLGKMLIEGVDSVVLGCTHYPMLIPIIKRILPQHIALIDSGEAVARQTKHILEIKNMLRYAANKKEHVIYSNGNNIAVLTTFLKQLKIENCLVKQENF
ncbi:MAG: glutamate racemase [Flavobacteriales bacterium]|nr:glutamate racemase [Flavobacteriales bacterium]MCW8914182.1 glutamate racemase [Flavobacteriales bacterium]MCW8936443.1 glutamate racemase [Flavobacteriales bacterium]MCW8967597.1 glutamate racemase [Flavobacteriales bacterium]MCW8991286.1 glutamate racemase [Flavobacteriales bacterium]